MKKGVRKVGRGDGPRNVLPVALLSAENAALDQVIHETGMKKTEAIRRLLVWFTAQNDLVQKTVLGIAPRTGGNALAGVLRSLASELEEKHDPRPITLAVEGEGNVRFEEYPSSPKTASDERGRPTA
jgi:hypothetical protein